MLSNGKEHFAEQQVQQNCVFRVIFITFFPKNSPQNVSDSKIPKSSVLFLRKNTNTERSPVVYSFSQLILNLLSMLLFSLGSWVGCCYLG